MKKTLQLSKLIFGGVIVWQVASAFDPTNPPAAATGAPLETTCSTRSGCHTGGTYTGTLTVTGLPDTVIANTLYTVTLRGNIASAVNTGFEMTVLDGANVKAGTLTVGTGSGVITASGREYIRNTARTSFSAGSASWTFSWRAPASAASNSITFYYSMMAANGNNSTTGDNALAGTKAVTFKLASGTTNIEKDKIAIYPTPATHTLTIDNKCANGQQTIATFFDINGRTISESKLNPEKNVIDVQNWARGQYWVRITNNGQTMTQPLVLK